MRGALAVVEKRLQLRAGRPIRESFQDSFQEALCREREVILNARRQLGLRVKSGGEVLEPLEEAREEMIKRQNTFHLDRSAWPHEFLTSLRQLEARAAEFCQSASLLMSPLGREVGQANAQVVTQMKVRTRELYDSRMRLHREIGDSRSAIYALEHSQEKVRKEMRSYCSYDNSVSGEGLAGDDEIEEAIQQRELLPPEVVDSLRAKIKSASYTGQEGRDIGTVFARFDRDGSGDLEEVEFKRAMRRTLRIAPTVISDAEISLLFAMLDEDASGTINVQEIMSFLSAESLQKVLLERLRTIEQFKVDLEGNLQQLLDDYQNKTAAWKIDDGCAKVTAAQGLALDGSAFGKKKPSQADGLMFSARAGRPLSKENTKQPLKGPLRANQKSQMPNSVEQARTAPVFAMADPIDANALAHVVVGSGADADAESGLKAAAESGSLEDALSTADSGSLKDTMVFYNDDARADSAGNALAGKAGFKNADVTPESADAVAFYNDDTLADSARNALVEHADPGCTDVAPESTDTCAFYNDDARADSAGNAMPGVAGSERLDVVPESPDTASFNNADADAEAAGKALPGDAPDTTASASVAKAHEAGGNFPAPEAALASDCATALAISGKDLAGGEDVAGKAGSATADMPGDIDAALDMLLQDL